MDYSGIEAVASDEERMSRPALLLDADEWTPTLDRLFEAKQKHRRAADYLAHKIALGHFVDDTIFANVAIANTAYITHLAIYETLGTVCDLLREDYGSS